MSRYLMFASINHLTTRNAEIAVQAGCGPVTQYWFTGAQNLDGRAAFIVADGDELKLSQSEQGVLSETLWEQIELPNPCYISATGSRDGSGTEIDPTLMEVGFTALSSVVAGTEFIVMSGVYIGSYQYYHDGTEAERNRIIFQNGAVINGSLSIYGNNTDVIDPVCRGTPSTRWTDLPGDGHEIIFENYGQYAYGILIHGENVNILHGEVSNDFNGLYPWQDALNGKYYGVHIYNNGWGAPDRGHGHAVYTQNAQTSLSRVFEQLVIAQGYGGGMRFYSSAGQVHGCNMIDCVQIGDRFLLGGSEPITGTMIVDGLCLYDSYILAGVTDKNNEALVIQNCYLRGRIASGGPITINFWDSITIKNNVIVGDSDGPNRVGLIQLAVSGDEIFDIDYNTYYFYNCSTAVFTVLDYSSGSIVVKYYTIGEWQALGRDVHSTFIFDVPPNHTKIMYSEYDNDRATVIIYNFEQLQNVDIDLSGGSLTLGSTYRLHSAQNPSEYYEFAYSGNPVSVPMTGWTVAQPYNGTIGYGATWPDFAAFILMAAN